MDIQIVSDDTGLQSCLNNLQNTDEIAVDLEFDKNFYRFGFNLCLMQIQCNGTSFLVDPLSSNVEIKHLFPVLEDPSVQKIVFSFGEDLRLLHSMGCFPKNLYDLSIAAALLNYPPASLTNLLSDVLNRDTGKSSQQSNWFRRPLSDQQIHYAAQDVCHLADLKKILDDKADNTQIASWIAEENKLLTEQDFSETDNNNIIKDKDKKDFSEYEWHQYKALIRTREEIAEKYNIPGYQVVDKNYLIDVAKKPELISRFKSARGIHRRVDPDYAKKRFEKSLDQAVSEAESHQLSKTEPAQKSPTAEEWAEIKEQKKKLDHLKNVFFTPVKNRMNDDLGEQTTTFLFSNRVVAEITVNPGALQPDYKRQLLIRYGRELGLDTGFLEI
jgi:ribonuclease D